MTNKPQPHKKPRPRVQPYRSPDKPKKPAKITPLPSQLQLFPTTKGHHS